MAQIAFEFDAQDLYQLLVHYTDGECPLGGQILQIGVNPYLERMVGLLVESAEWDTDEPLQIRYQGGRVASWSEASATDSTMEWVQRADTPQAQS